MDAEGGVWSALWGSGAVIRYDPEGREERRVVLPVSNVTSMTFGGDSLEDLYITTARGAGDTSPEAGGLYRARPGVRGTPEPLARLRRSGVREN